MGGVVQEKKEKWLFIINPVAGNGFAGKYDVKVKEMTEKYNADATIVFTERKGHATEITEQFLEKGTNYFVSVGGDGTANEIAKVLVNKRDVTMGVIAAGTGNDMIQILGFPDRFTDKEWEIFFQKNTIGMDVGKVNENYFLNGLGIGFDAKVASENYTADGHVIKDQGSKYLWHILKNLFFYKPSEMKILLDQESVQVKSFLNTFAIGRRFAAKYFLTPKAIANDGLLDVCIIRDLGILDRLKIFMQVPKGAHMGNTKVDYYKIKKATIKFDHDVPHHLDGEIFFASEFDVSLIPKGLKIIYNPHGPHYFNID